jgi:glycosidase
MRRPFRPAPALLGAAAAAVLLAAGCDGGTSTPPPPLLPATRAPAASTDWWNGAVTYEVFVRSFRDSDGDGSGDLAGLIEKLDHLNDCDAPGSQALGVDAIWLMPIFPSPSYHGYDVTDYAGVNPDYGTMADLDRLVAEAHARCIKVILDWVPNHTSVAHPWFVESQSPTSPRRDWYVWRPSNPYWGQPWGGGTTWYAAGGSYYYAVFWSGMPDLNWRNPAVAAEIGAAAAGWLARGVDGFRLDAVRYLVENGSGAGQQDQPETHAALKAFASAVRGAAPAGSPAMLVGEAWADTPTIATYFGSTAARPEGDELPLAFNFPLADEVVNGVNAGRATGIAAKLDDVARAYPPGTGDAPFLTNHDQVRVATRLGGDPAKLRLAAAILLTLQGSPFLYYGEEIGMANGTCGSDECKRTPMAWDGTPKGGFTSGTPWWPLSPGTAAANVTAQLADPASLLSRYRALIRARKGSPALSRGGTERHPTEGANVLSFLRTDPTETVLVAHNLGGATVTQSVPGTATALEPILADPGASASPGAGSVSFTLPPRGSGIWRLR